MRKLILPLTIFCSFICAVPAKANFCQAHYYYPNNLATATGTVKATGLNSIDIFDEDQKRVERFVYLGNEQFSQGEYVRVYYQPMTAVVSSIKKMTVLEYKQNGQNLGNIFRDNRRN